eukprot:5097196-Amphidinium_carterae.1
MNGTEIIAKDLYLPQFPPFRPARAITVSSLKGKSERQLSLIVEGRTVPTQNHLVAGKDPRHT